MSVNPEDESRDGRYFPNEGEISVLSHYVKIYFSHPERSDKRSQVVQEVVSKLSTSNTHWNSRNVRLWFNNNKRIAFGTMGSNSTNEIEQQTSPPQFPGITIKRISPNRSISMMCLVPSLEHNQTQIDKLGKRTNSFGNNMISVSKNHKAKENTIAYQLSYEKQCLSQDLYSSEKTNQSIQRISDAIVNNYKSQTDYLNFSINRSSSIVIPQDFPYFYEPLNHSEFDLIETSCSVDGSTPAAIVFANGTSALWLDNKVSPMRFSYPVSSIAYDKAQNLIWIHSFCSINSFSLNDNSFIHSLTIGSFRSQNSVMMFHNDFLYFASGSTIICWSPEDLHEASDSLHFTRGVSTLLSGISSITSVSDVIVFASTEHYVPHVLSQNGSIVSRPMGHSGGVTSLGSFDENCFISGSQDQTARLWDIRYSSSSMNLIGHKGIITSVNSYKDLVFTGGTDGIVNVWDVRQQMVLKSFKTGLLPPQTITFNEKTNEICIVTSQNTYDTFSDLEKYGETEHTNHYNSILTFRVD